MMIDEQKQVKLDRDVILLLKELQTEFFRHKVKNYSYSDIIRELVRVWHGFKKEENEMKE